MSTFKKHVGRIKNTDRRCVVIYMQIPGNEENALIVDTDALPDRFHDALMPLIDSVEGQSTPHLHTLLSRRILPDYGIDMLNAMHRFGLLRPVPIDNIIMYPAPNAPCPLRTIVDHINGTVAPKATDLTLENRHLENQAAERDTNKMAMAQSMLRGAEDLEREAHSRREQAYRIMPHLRPEAQAELANFIPNTAIQGSETVTEGLVDNLTNATIVGDDNAFSTEDEAHEAPLFQQDDTADLPVVETVIIADDLNNLPDDVAAALLAAQKELIDAQIPTGDDEEIAHEVDTSDEAIQAFLDRAALREDMADKEAWAARQPKKPVGRPRADGKPAGTVEKPAPRPPGRPRKDPNAPVKPKAKSKTKPKSKAKVSGK